jgi:hypothetical protein
MLFCCYGADWTDFYRREYHIVVLGAGKQLAEDIHSEKLLANGPI